MKRRFNLFQGVVLGAVILWGGFGFGKGGIAPGWGQEAPTRGAEQPSEEQPPIESPGEQPPSTEAPTPPAGEAGPLPSAEEVIVPEVPSEGEAQGKVIPYTVKEGDTLWGISESILRDPFLWPKVWRNNPYINNPDLIYPGNTITFPTEVSPVEEIPPVKAPSPAELVPPAPPRVEGVPPAPEVALVPPVETPPMKPSSALSLLASAGFILTDQKPSGTVVGSPDDRKLLSESDIIYMVPASEATLTTGDRLTLYRKVRKVYHPKTRKYVGDLIRILGVAEITESQGRVKTAKILDSYDYIVKGDLALPYQPPELIAPASTATEPNPAGPLQGYIVEIKEDRVTQVQSDIVYLDRGSRDGLKVGDRFVVIRPGEKTPFFSPGRGERLPQRIIGHIEVLIAREATSTARIIKSTDVIYKGDQFESPPTP